MKRNKFKINPYIMGAVLLILLGSLCIPVKSNYHIISKNDSIMHIQYYPIIHTFIYKDTCISTPDTVLAKVSLEKFDNNYITTITYNDQNLQYYDKSIYMYFLNKLEGDSILYKVEEYWPKHSIKYIKYGK